MSLLLTYVIPGNDLSQLHDELLAAGLVPEQVRGETVYTENPPASGFFTAADTVYLTMPDGTVEADVDTVVAAHVPMVRYDPATQLARVAALRQQATRQSLVLQAAVAADIATLREVLVAHLMAEEAHG